MNVPAVQGIARNISERKRREEELQRHCDKVAAMAKAQTAELLAAKTAAEEAGQAKKEFLENMSHELRMPVHAILSFARFGRERSGSMEGEKLAEFFDRIWEGGNRLLALIDNLLDLSGIGAGHLTLDRRPTDLAEMVRAVRQDVTPMLEARHLVCNVNAAADAGKANVDADRIGQVVRTLLVDAIRFAPDGTDIVVTVSRGRRPARRAGDDGDLPAIKLTVADRGAGAAAELAQLFDLPGADDRPGPEAAGRGGGLNACRDIVEAHGGIITVRNRDGGGIEFDVLLPIC
jgi:signal transduction histidine kinase